MPGYVSGHSFCRARFSDDQYLEFVLDVDQSTSIESGRWNVRNVYRVIPDSDVVLVCRTFLQSRQLLAFLLPPLVRLVVDHLEKNKSTEGFHARINKSEIYSAGNFGLTFDAKQALGAPCPCSPVV